MAPLGGSSIRSHSRGSELASRSMLQRLASNTIPETMPAAALGGPIALSSLPSFNRLARARTRVSMGQARQSSRLPFERAKERDREKRSSPNLLRNLVAASTHWPAPTLPACARRYTFIVLRSYTSGAHSRSWRWWDLPASCSHLPWPFVRSTWSDYLLSAVSMQYHFDSTPIITERMPVHMIGWRQMLKYRQPKGEMSP
ncbi:hypothetical protein V8C34DRAFT_61585 [Trichoderma compactum]